MEEKRKEKVLPELVELARSVSTAHNHEATQPSIKKKIRLVLPSYSSASEEDEVQFLVVKEKQVLKEDVKILEEDKKVPVAQRSPRMRNVPNPYLPRRKTRETNKLRLSSKLGDNSMIRDLIINIDESPEDKVKEVKKKVPAIKQKPGKRVTKREGLKLLFSTIDSLN